MSQHTQILAKYRAGDVLGSYRINWHAATMAPAAQATLFSFRWVDQSAVALVERVAVSVSVMSSIAAQVLEPITLIVCRQFITDQTTNFQQFYHYDNTGKSFVDMPTSRVGQTCYAVGGGISGATFNSQDTLFLGKAPLVGLGAVGSNTPSIDLLNVGQSESWPLILSANEGFLVQWGYTALASGTVRVSAQFSWSEVELESEF